jgi:ribosomal-protein-alanine N-acetyltransferase
MRHALASPLLVIRTTGLELVGRRVRLRPLQLHDFDQWQEVRLLCADWLLKWESAHLDGYPDPVEDRRAFASRCGARERERQLGSGYGFGVFVGTRFAGEMNLSGIQRGPFQNGFVGYWIDQAVAGQSYTPEAAAVLFRFAFEELGLHRIQVSIIPRNAPSRRVAAKLGLWEEGVAVRFLEINGVWEDHVCYAMTSEEWWDRREDFNSRWF